MSGSRFLLQNPPILFRMRNQLELFPPVNWLRRWKRPRQADLYLLSYPKTGRTWLRVMMSRMVAEHMGHARAAQGEAEIDLTRLPGTPRIVEKHDGRPQIKTVAEINSDKSEFAGCKVILLVRDLRDTLVSNYFQATRRRNRFEGDISTFVHWPRGSFESLLCYYNTWAAQRHVPEDFLLVRYEDLHEDPGRELRRVAEFIGLAEVSSASIAAAVEHGRFDSMKAREAERSPDGSALAPGRPGDAESFKSRRGKIGGYVDYLSAEDVAWLNRRIDAELDPYYGYSSSPWPGPVQDR
jgi:hypothetical protein